MLKVLLSLFGTSYSGYEFINYALTFAFVYSVNLSYNCLAFVFLLHKYVFNIIRSKFQLLVNCKSAQP